MDEAAHLQIYLDHNATTPLAPEVSEAMRQCYDTPLLNPSSQHSFGRAARRKLEEARQRIAELLGAKTAAMDADRVVFTSGGTEANNLAIRGLTSWSSVAHQPLPEIPHTSAESGSTDRPAPHLIISAIEHPSVSALADQMSLEGWQIDRIGVDTRGVIRVDELRHMLRPETRLVGAILGHNETGALQPVAEIAALCRDRDVPLHTDGAQVVGKMPVDFRALGAATLSAAAHKFHGPLGIGVLLIRHDIELTPQLFGGFQQGALRPGTESVALAVGMCRALELWHVEQRERFERMRLLRDRFEQTLLEGDVGAVVLAVDAPRLPHVSNMAFIGLDRQALFLALDQAGIACSTGSACASGSSEPSPAHLAMGLRKELISSALRFSFGANSTVAEVNESARRILRCCKDLRRRKQP